MLICNIYMFFLYAYLGFYLYVLLIFMGFFIKNVLYQHCDIMRLCQKACQFAITDACSFHDSGLKSVGESSLIKCDCTKNLKVAGVESSFQILRNLHSLHLNRRSHPMKRILLLVCPLALKFGRLLKVYAISPGTYPILITR